MHLRAATRSLARSQCMLRRYSSNSQSQGNNIASLLSEPTWSVRSLLPDSASQSSAPSISPKQLHHLLRLSALPPPATPEEERSMLQTLESQIHFVKEMQSVDTTGVEPLRSIRDETLAANKETSIGLDRLKDALAQEHVSGRRKRIQRVEQEKTGRSEGSIWDGDALQSASKTKGPYFVVETGPGASATKGTGGKSA
ncbi:hypothetical protein N7481_006328 [Penicillium waksmanii]|uniref:uncharacterized protein n=1 Tax=Penicillium waksmanii TaxID=69791 RepID=UPI002547CC94|nr:uncharacterized protein N7481_006328 [Penicillium waksmanii]KAJ5984229.1 hypothetical protein N7481_006328 [Penicillium waksmanii]